MPGCTIEQPHAELTFEIGDVLARHRRRNVEALGGLHEAASFDHFTKHAQAGERIHRSDSAGKQKRDLSPITSAIHRARR
ncbi:hypothetical protein BURKHO8Y_170178 [Burkholderia sp. 8Y]|nr:hypothetical protein BURKHO8Y_170178 [Burkholderia sp. 8Y]